MTQGVTEVGCLAHARRKFFDLHAANKSQIAHSALEQIARVYDIEREIKELLPDERRRIRQERSKPLLDALHQWMVLNRQKITDGTATAKALDYSLRRWGALTRFLNDGQLSAAVPHLKIRNRHSIDCLELKRHAILFQFLVLLKKDRVTQSRSLEAFLEGYCLWVLSLLPPTILQPHRQIKHRLRTLHVVHPIRHKVPMPLKLEVLARQRIRQ